MGLLRHHQVFGAHGADVESLFEQMDASLNAYQYALGEGAGTLALAAVLYGAATPAAIAGPAWHAYRLGMRLNGAEIENPFVSRIERFQRRGARFFVCRNSMRGLAIAVANGVPQVQEPVDAVLQNMRVNVVRGVTVIPAGVAAINALQEAGYTYAPATL